MINIEEAKNFFCRASVERFEERIETRNVFGNHLAGVCIFEEDDWKYVFFRSRDGAIAIGLVVLWLDGNPVWKMELGGPYTRECGKFLTTAILANLKNNDFNFNA